MQKQYNKKLNFRDYAAGEKVWLKVKFYKTGENRKLSPRRNGPWTVLSKLPNGVNFRIANDKTREEKVVHHDRISPVKGEVMLQPSGDKVRPLMPKEAEPFKELSESSDSNSDVHSEYEPSSESSSGEESSSEDNDPAAGPRYGRRNRRQRVIPGGLSWREVDDAGLLN